MKVFGMLALGLVVTGCSLGQGTGELKSDKLFAHECWGQADGGGSFVEQSYDLQPDFFAANSYRSTLQIRVQHGNDLQEVSDGLTVLIDDVPKIREAIAVARTLKAKDAGVEDAGAPSSSRPDACVISGAVSDPLGPHANGTATFQVALPAGVTPSGSPSVPPADLLDAPPLVHIAFFLQRSCHNQNTVLYAVSGQITFASLFNGDPNEASAEEKLIDVTKLDVQVGDLRDVPLGSYPREIPCELQSRLEGKFKFYFDRGQPAQPFP